MGYLNIDILKMLSGALKPTGESTTTESAASSTAKTMAANAVLRGYEDELVELDDRSDLDIAKIVIENASVEELDNQILEKEQEIADLTTKTQEYIKKCQAEIQNIFATGTDVIPAEVQSAYDSKYAAILFKTGQNTGSIQEYLATISENKSTIKTAEDEIEDKTKEIEKYNKEIESLKDKNDEDSKARIEKLEGKIDGLNASISNLNYIINQANKTIEQSVNECNTLEEENSKLQESQQGLMESLMADYYKTHDEKDRVQEDSALMSEISGLENCIRQANTNLSENSIKLTNDIQILQEQRVIKERENAALAASRSSGGTTVKVPSSYSVANTNYTGDLPVNNNLASIARSTASSMNSTGWCLKGVNNTLEKAYGFRLSYNSAYQAIPALQSRGDFAEVTNQYSSPQDLKNLPAGAIVVWENSGSHPHGHISIALGNGQEASDHIQNQTTNYGTKFHVFVKKG